MTVAEVLEQVKALSPEERNELTALLIGLVDLDTTSLQRRLSELRGVGKEIWQGVDAQAYVDQMRDEWDQPR